MLAVSRHLVPCKMFMLHISYIRCPFGGTVEGGSPNLVFFPHRWAHQMPANMCTVSTREEYNSALLQCKARHGLVVVDFFAPWCAGCRRLYPKMRQIAAANLDVAFIKVWLAVKTLLQAATELSVEACLDMLQHIGRPSLSLR